MSTNTFKYIQWRSGMKYCVASESKAKIRWRHPLPQTKNGFQPPPILEVEVVPAKSRFRNCLWVCVNLSVSNDGFGITELYVSTTLDEALRRKRELQRTITMSEPIKIRYTPTLEPTVEDMKELKNAK